MSGALTAATPQTVLRTIFGYESFRAPQGEIINHIQAGGDALALMPTAAGKSLCYQIPALCRAGTGIVVSPLVALMRAQVQELRSKGVAATALYAGLAPEEKANVLRDLANGQLDLLYLAPERATSPGFLSALNNVSIALIAVDEAHCVS
jgi:ATP-dependent DNA helicase RecQ